MVTVIWLVLRGWIWTTLTFPQELKGSWWDLLWIATIHSNGPTISSFTHIEDIALGADMRLLEEQVAWGVWGRFYRGASSRGGARGERSRWLVWHHVEGVWEDGRVWLRENGVQLTDERIDQWTSLRCLLIKVLFSSVQTLESYCFYLDLLLYAISYI